MWCVDLLQIDSQKEYICESAFSKSMWCDVITHQKMYSVVEMFCLVRCRAEHDIVRCVMLGHKQSTSSSTQTRPADSHVISLSHSLQTGPLPAHPDHATAATCSSSTEPRGTSCWHPAGSYYWWTRQAFCDWTRRTPCRCHMTRLTAMLGIQCEAEDSTLAEVPRTRGGWNFLHKVCNTLRIY